MILFIEENKLSSCALSFKYTLKPKMYITFFQGGNLKVVRKTNLKIFAYAAWAFEKVIFKDWRIKHLSFLPAGVDVKITVTLLPATLFCTCYYLSYGHFTHGNLIRLSPMIVYKMLFHWELKQFYKVLREKH